MRVATHPGLPESGVPPTLLVVVLYEDSTDGSVSPDAPTTDSWRTAGTRDTAAGSVCRHSRAGNGAVLAWVRGRCTYQAAALMPLRCCCTAAVGYRSRSGPSVQCPVCFVLQHLQIVTAIVQAIKVGMVYLILVTWVTLPCKS